MTVAQRATADRLLGEKGQLVTLTRKANGSYSTVSGSSSVTTSTVVANAVILPFSAGVRYMAGTNIGIGERQCYLSGLDSSGNALASPELNDTLTDANGDIFTIVDIAELAPAGLNIIYDLTIRGT